jgi:hypothetical protein
MTKASSCLEIVGGALSSPPFLPHPPAHGASLSPATKNSSISLYSSGTPSSEGNVASSYADSARTVCA